MHICRCVGVLPTKCCSHVYIYYYYCSNSVEMHICRVVDVCFQVLQSFIHISLVIQYIGILHKGIHRSICVKV